MMQLVARRLLLAVPMLLVVSFLIFALVALAPGDPALRLAGDNPSPEQVEQVRKALKLDLPLAVRYVQWLGGAAQLDFGRSFSTSQEVMALIADKAGVTLSLTGVALLITLIAGTAIGIAAALWPGGWLDRVLTSVSALAAAMPSFWFAIVLVIWFALHLRIFPAVGYAPLSEGFAGWLHHLILPAMALALTPAAETALQLRSAVSEAMSSDYVLAAFAKGVPHHGVVLKHALKNAAIPVVTVLGVRVSLLLGGAVTIEQVFALNGLGTLAVTSTLSGDVPVLLGLTMLATLVVILCNLAVDISYGYFNPRVRH